VFRDAADHAAWLAGMSMTSTPLLGKLSQRSARLVDFDS
jgi:hypothetical protein